MLAFLLSCLIIVDDNLVVEKILCLQDAVREFDNQLQILHVFGELHQASIFQLPRCLGDVRFESLQVSQDGEHLIVLRIDRVVKLIFAASVHFEHRRSGLWHNLWHEKVFMDLERGELMVARTLREEMCVLHSELTI